MDNIITLIVVIITILSVAGKIRGKSKKAQTPKSQGSNGWIARLNTYLDGIQKRVEQQGQPSMEQDQDEMSASTWRALMERDTVSVSASHPGDDEYDLGDLELEFVEEPETPKTKKVPEPPRISADAPLEPPVVTDAPQPALERVRKLRRFNLPLNPTELRRAVIWSEIIGPPVSLRDYPYDGP
jgi:hypothetical protein